MGKVTRFTGSKVLGAELKRLRGGRTLAEVAELSKSTAFRDRIRPVSAPTMCQIESGQTMPTLDTLHSLATLYRVNPQRLYDLIVEDRLTTSHVVPDTEDETRTSFDEAKRHGDWDRALALAIHAENLAVDESGRVAWRADRATCLRHLGMGQDATWLLHECLDEPGLAAEKRHAVLSNLANAYAAAGLTFTASLLAKEALAQAPADAPVATRIHLLRVHARLLLVQADTEAEGETAKRLAREALRCLDQAASLGTDGDDGLRLSLGVERAVAQRLAGNALVAATELERLSRASREAGLAPLEMLALENLGMLRHAQGKWAHAERALEKAESLAIQLKDHDQAFEIAFELHLVAKAMGETAKSARHLKRCQRHYPLVSMRTPNLKAYERLRESSR